MNLVKTAIESAFGVQSFPLAKENDMCDLRYFSMEKDPFYTLSCKKVRAQFAMKSDLDIWRRCVYLIEQNVSLVPKWKYQTDDLRYTIPHFLNLIALNSRRGRGNVLIVNRNDLEKVRNGFNIPENSINLKPKDLGPVYLGEMHFPSPVCDLQIVYDGQVSDPIVLYKGVTKYDNGIVIGMNDLPNSDGKYSSCVKFVNPSYFVRFKL